MLLGERTGVWSGGGALPYDREVAYLISNGNQYINLGPIPGIGTGSGTVEFGMVFPASVFGYRGYIGTKVKQNNYDQFTFFLNSSIVYSTLLVGNVSIYQKAINLISPGNSYDFVVSCDDNGSSLKINGSEYEWTQNGIFIASESEDFYLFKNGDRQGFEALGMTFFKTTGNRFRKLDMIPVVKNVDGNDVGYMYDRVSGQLFGNAGTGAFTWSELNAAAGGGGIS